MLSSIDILFHLVFLVGSLPISIIDMKTLRIPNALVYPLFLALLVMTVLCTDLIIPKIITSASVAALLFLIRLATKGLGMGDIKLGACIGLYCGLTTILPALLLAAAFGIVVALALIILKKIDHKTPLPFAPFLTLGAIVGQFFPLW